MLDNARMQGLRFTCLLLRVFDLELEGKVTA
jgi:hypothetical protein